MVSNGRINATSILIITEIEDRMKYKERILRIVLSFFSFFANKIRQKENRITFITLESDKLENDFLMLSKELEKCGGYELKYHLVKFEKTIIGNLKYLIACIYQLFFDKFE